MQQPLVKSLSEPDATRRFRDGSTRGRVDLASVAIGRGVYEPGWQWSSHAAPRDGAEAAHHVGLVLSGRMGVRGPDGTELEVGPGEAFEVPAGHDAWVIGHEQCVALDITPRQTA